MKRVMVGRSYLYQPVGADLWDGNPALQPGATVTVVHPSGCPRPGTFGHCHVTAPSVPCALVLLNSLQPVTKARAAAIQGV